MAEKLQPLLEPEGFKQIKLEACESDLRWIRIYKMNARNAGRAGEEGSGAPSRCDHCNTEILADEFGNSQVDERILPYLGEPQWELPRGF